MVCVFCVSCAPFFIVVSALWRRLVVVSCVSIRLLNQGPRLTAEQHFRLCVCLYLCVCLCACVCVSVYVYLLNYGFLYFVVCVHVCVCHVE